jgi:oligoribonuclease (3'-5' exoribonuclease)
MSIGPITKGLAHRALADIKESFQELRYLQNAIYRTPGPAAAEAR